MATQTIKPVILKYSKPIQQRAPRKKYRALNSGRQLNGEVIDKTIHAYRMWFLFLKLGLELEEQGAELIMKRRRNGVNRTKKVKVNRKKYIGWDLDEVLRLNFNDWWESHKNLFNDEVANTLDCGEIVNDDPNYLTIKVDLRMRINDIISSVGDEVKRNKRARKKLLTKKIPKFSINGNIHKISVVNRYNCLILKLENELSNKEIIEHPKNYIRNITVPLNTHYGYMDYSRVAYGLFAGTGKTFGAKQILLSVCDGYFLKHPKKTYLD